MNSPEPTEKCSEVLSLLSEYLNLELPPGACQNIESHLAGCTACDEFAQSLRETVQLCRRYRPSELPAPLGNQARDQLLEAYRKMLSSRERTASL